MGDFLSPFPTTKSMPKGLCAANPKASVVDRSNPAASKSTLHETDSNENLTCLQWLLFMRTILFLIVPLFLDVRCFCWRLLFVTYGQVQFGKIRWSP